MPDRYPAIEDHAVVGDLHTVALVESVRTRQLYMPDSNVLVTRFLGADSVGEVVDFMVSHHDGGSLMHPGTCWSVSCGRYAEPSFHDHLPPGI